MQKTIKGFYASETGFAVGAPMLIESDPLSDALEIELRHSLIGHQTSALQAMLDILEKR